MIHPNPNLIDRFILQQHNGINNYLYTHVTPIIIFIYNFQK